MAAVRTDGDAVHDERRALAAREAHGMADILPMPGGQAAAFRGRRFGLDTAHLARGFVVDEQTPRLARSLESGSLGKDGEQRMTEARVRSLVERGAAPRLLAVTAVLTHVALDCEHINLGVNIVVNIGVNTESK